MANKYFYFVEGECEQAFINELKKKKEPKIKPGKVKIFNVVNQLLSPREIRVIDKDYHIIFVYDIDVANIEILNKNINLLKKYNFKNVHHIQSINSFEDELVYSTSLTKINEMFNTKSVEEFKSKFIKQKNLYVKLKEINYDNNKMWSRVNKKLPFSKYSNQKDLNLIKK